MDNVTHTLFALTLAQTRTARAVPGSTATLLIASNAPDIDIVTALTGGAVSYLAAHRGATHGPLGIASLAVTASLLVWAYLAWRGRRGPGGFHLFIQLSLVAIVGTVLHVLMDLPTVYGTRVLSPFSDRWFSFDWLPIIDIHLWTALLTGLFMTRIRPAATSRIITAVLVVMAGNYLLRATAHDRALTLAAHPSPVFRPASWPGDARHKLDPCRGRLVDRQTGCHAIAVPTFFSPFQWRVIRAHDDFYELGDINLLNPVEAGPSARFAVEGGVWTDRAAMGSTAQIFLGFARAPSARVRELPGGGATVTFRDLRFVRGPVDAGDEGGAGLFTVTSVIDADGRILTEQLRD